MGAETNPPTTDVLSRAINAMTALVLRRPWAILAVAGALCGVCCWYVASEMKFFTSRLHLLNPNSEFNKRWLAYIEEFGDEDDVVVVVKGASREQVTPLLDAVADDLAREPERFKEVLHRVDLSAIRSKGLYYLSEADLHRIEGFLARMGPILNGDWSQLNTGNLLAGLTWQIHQARAQRQEPSLAEVREFSASLVQALADSPAYRSPLPNPVQDSPLDIEDRPQYILFDEGRLGLVLLHLAKTEAAFTSGADVIDRLRAILAKHQAAAPEGVEIGLTGLPIMENDEMRSSSDTMTLATILSTVGVMVMFWAGFGGWRHMLLSIVSLLVGMIWSFGYLTLAVGHLNILTVSFAVILIGLGIDFNIHYSAKYLALRARGVGRVAALRSTAADVGPGVVTGALTTAAAFFVAGFSEFTGIAELGVIAGGGVILCCVASLIVLPSLVQVCDPAGTMRISQPLPLGHWMLPLLRKEKTIVALFAVATLACGYGLTKLWYDHNLLHLQPVGLDSVVWEKTLLRESKQSAWYALSIAESPAELLERKKKFLALPTVHRVEELASLVPTNFEAKKDVVGRLGAAVRNVGDQVPVIPVVPPEKLVGWIANLKGLLVGLPGSEELTKRLESLEATVAKLSLSDYYRRMADFQQQLAGDVWSRLDSLKNVSGATPPSLEDLPESLVKRFVGKQGRFLLKIYANGDIWDMDRLERFVADVRSVDPEATGKPLQTYEASRQMLAGYQTSALWAFAVISVLLFVDFRSLTGTLWALLPLILGTIQTFGLLGLLGVPMNPANIIALPVVLGVGVDNGVHVVHDFRRRKGRYRLSNSTANSILLCSMTTIVGFGSLMIADHKGVESLGRVMTIGVVACLLNSAILLPAILGWVSRGEAEVDENAEVDQEAAELLAVEASARASAAPDAEPTAAPLAARDAVAAPIDESPATPAAESPASAEHETVDAARSAADARPDPSPTRAAFRRRLDAAPRPSVTPRFRHVA